MPPALTHCPKLFLYLFSPKAIMVLGSCQKMLFFIIPCRVLALKFEISDDAAIRHHFGSWLKALRNGSLEILMKPLKE
jgi:hypothetical protein